MTFWFNEFKSRCEKCIEFEGCILYLSTVKNRFSEFSGSSQDQELLDASVFEHDEFIKTLLCGHFKIKEYCSVPSILLLL